MKIAIFTTFLGFDNAYSLCNVVADQVAMFKGGGYEPVVIVAKGFKKVGIFESVEVREIPPVQLHNDGNLGDNYEDEIVLMTEALRVILDDIDVVLTHDVIYQPAHLIHNVAARKIAEEKPNIRWLHWIHSATSPRVLCNRADVKGIIAQPFKNSYICYPNEGDRNRVANNFKFNVDDVKIVPHPIDIKQYFGFSDLTSEFIDKYYLLEQEVLMLYPCRLDRGKQPEANIKLIAAFNRIGMKAKLIVADFHSTGGDKVVYRDELKKTAETFHLTPQDVIFTSDFKPETKASVPREMVRELFQISNVFLLPSVSETYSLVAQEAAMCGNVVVLNYDFPPMKSIYGYDPLYYKFGSNLDLMTGTDGSTITKYENENFYYNGMAYSIKSELVNNRVVHLKDKIRLERSLSAVFKNNIEPLIHAQVKTNEV